jgi:NAD+ diphosphatase
VSASLKLRAYRGGVISAELPLSRTTTDRAADLRERPDLVASMLTDATTRVLMVHDGSVVTRGGDREPALVLLPPGQAALLSPGGELPEGWIFLGVDDVDGLPGASPTETRPAGAPGYLARLVPDVESAVLLAGHRWSPLREIGAVLSARDAGLATAAVALERWHVRHPRCPRCGAATRSEQSGWVRRCVADGSEHYPRSDPAVIMAVVDEADRLLLGHGAQWPLHRYSTLAGFVEPGESVEHAIRREVREEVGVTVGAVEYRGSQPWPFPGSLMLGFRAHALTTAVTVDAVEVTAARWFTRMELRAGIRSGSVGLPNNTSIAHALIEEWYGSELPDAL